MDNLYYEVESIVMALWEESIEEISLEVVSRLNITQEHASDLVHQVIREEQQLEEELSDGEEHLFDWDDTSSIIMGEEYG